jgi:hypothetical protein
VGNSSGPYSTFWHSRGLSRYKLTLAVSARSSDVLGDCLDAAKALKTVNPKVIEHDPVV